MPKGIGDVAMEAILEGSSDEEALSAVLREHPGAGTKIASIKWYRSKLRREAKEGKREPGREGAPRRRVGGLIPDREMSPETKAELAERRVTDRDRLHAERMERQEERMRSTGDPGRWRRGILSRYVKRVLSLKGEERLDFFEAHPVREMFV